MSERRAPDGPASRGRRFIVSGRVQGVAYRASAQRKATELGLTGWVRNLPDGSVEACAVGTTAQLAAFEDWLWQGPRLAAVTAVTGHDAPVEPLDAFVVRA